MMLARGLGDTAVLNAGRTGGFTSAAQQAKIDMLFEALVKLDTALGRGFDQMNPAAWRFGLETAARGRSGTGLDRGRSARSCRVREDLA